MVDRQVAWASANACRDGQEEPVMGPPVASHVYDPPEGGLPDIPYVAYVELPDGNVRVGTFRDRQGAVRFVNYVELAEVGQPSEKD